jgi:hypothetical protein
MTENHWLGVAMMAASSLLFMLGIYFAGHVSRPSAKRRKSDWLDDAERLARTDSVKVFEDVASRTLSPEDAAKLLTRQGRKDK